MMWYYIKKRKRKVTKGVRQIYYINYSSFTSISISIVGKFVQ